LVFAPYYIPKAVPHSPYTTPDTNVPYATPDIPNVPYATPDIPNVPYSTPDIPNVPYSTPDIPNVPYSTPDIPNAPYSTPDIPNVPLSPYSTPHNANVPRSPYSTPHNAPVPHSPYSTPHNANVPRSPYSTPHNVPYATPDNTDCGPEEPTNYKKRSEVYIDDSSEQSQNAEKEINDHADSINTEIENNLLTNEANLTTSKTSLMSDVITVEITVTLLSNSTEQTLSKICDTWRKALTDSCGLEFDDCTWTRSVKRQSGSVYNGTTTAHGPNSSGSSRLMIPGLYAVVVVIGFLLY